MSVDYAGRCSKLRQVMEKRDIDLVVFTPSPSFQYLTGCGCGWRNAADESHPRSTLFLPRNSEPTVLLEKDYASLAGRTCLDDIHLFGTEAEYQRAVSTVLENTKLPVKKAAIPSTAKILEECIQMQNESAEIVSAETLLDMQRLIKDPDEMSVLRKAAAITDAVMAAVVPLIKEGVTQIDLQDEILHRGIQAGAEGVSFPPGALFVKSGSPPSENPFTWPADKGLVPGTSVAFDFGFLVDGYCSDFGRSFYFGPADDKVKNAYHALGRSVEELVAVMREGSMTTGDLYPTIEKILDGYGVGDRLRARLTTGNLGHQIGIDVHEYPWLTPENDVPLAAGMVMAIEPKLWRAGEYYLRVEDIVAVGTDSTEFLTTFDRELFQL